MKLSALAAGGGDVHSPDGAHTNPGAQSSFEPQLSRQASCGGELPQRNGWQSIVCAQTPSEGAPAAHAQLEQ